MFIYCLPVSVIRYFHLPCLCVLLFGCNSAPKSTTELVDPLSELIIEEIPYMKFERRTPVFGAREDTLYLFGRTIGNPEDLVEQAEGHVNKYLEKRGFTPTSVKEVSEMIDDIMPVAPIELKEHGRVSYFEGPEYLVFSIVKTRRHGREVELSVTLREYHLNEG